MPKEAYQCSACSEVHESEYQAERCCIPDVFEVWLCDICGSPHEKEDDAENCCADRNLDGRIVTCPGCFRDYDSAMHTIEIQVAGHCSTCNPHFTHDEQFQITDLLEEHEQEHRTRQT